MVPKVKLPEREISSPWGCILKISTSKLWYNHKWPTHFSNCVLWMIWGGVRGRRRWKGWKRVCVDDPCCGPFVGMGHLWVCTSYKTLITFLKFSQPRDVVISQYWHRRFQYTPGLKLTVGVISYLDRYYNKKSRLYLIINTWVYCEMWGY